MTDGNSNLSGVTTEPGKMRECEGANHFGAGQADHHDSDSESDSDLEWVAGIKKRKRSTGQKKKWTDEERQLIKPLVSLAIRNGKPPTKQEVQSLQKKNPALMSIPWNKIKHQPGL